VKIGIAAAGSGGHVFPALAVADAMVATGLTKDDIVFFGGDRMEAEIVPAAGYPFVQVDMHGIRRSLSTDNLTLPLKIKRATAVVANTIEAEDIQAMVVFGGYVSGPAGRAARKRGIPLIIHEANAVPGVANRMLASSATTVYVAFEPARAKLRDGIVVGNPLRQVFEVFDRQGRRAMARGRYGIDPNATVLGVFGGSLGSAALNDIAAEIATDEPRSFEVLHLTGAPHYDQISSAAADVDGWTVVPFEKEMEWFYAASDVVISRAGAITVSELHATATPAILVPLPAGKGYQALNAADLVDGGGGIVIAQDHKDEIIAAAIDLLTDEAKRGTMTETAVASRHSGVARTIAEHVLEVARDDAK
jgi:UDP-N-acetylglucosamine--N-acetylmuramyl-(pentapeptide) pyrophosphoryl-undecaprenol N-acetylglucosamine transferase